MMTLNFLTSFKAHALSFRLFEQLHRWVGSTTSFYYLQKKDGYPQEHHWLKCLSFVSYC